MMTTLFALLKRELLEHKNIWRMPLILLGMAVLLKLSLSFGNLAINVQVPEALQLDNTIDGLLNSAIGKTVYVMNQIVMLVMFVVAIFYALTCLYNERQDQSVLFWRSLPIADWLTVLSKVLVALLLVPLVVIICQTLVVVLFFGADSGSYLGNHYMASMPLLAKKVLWSLLPVVAWCVLCSSIANKNPFLLAFITPIIFVLIDKLFLQGVISQTLLINRLTGVEQYTTSLFVSGLVFSLVCLTFATIKRSQRI